MTTVTQSLKGLQAEGKILNGIPPESLPTQQGLPNLPSTTQPFFNSPPINLPPRQRYSMNQDQIGAFVIGIGIIWLFCKYWKTRTPSTLSCAILLLCLQLARWPFYFPLKFSFALASFYAAGLVIYNRKQKKDPNAYIYGLLFICFGGVFLVEAYFKYFHNIKN